MTSGSPVGGAGLAGPGEAMRWTREVTPSRVTAELVIRWVCLNGGEARYLPRTADGPGTTHPRIAVRTRDGWAYCSPGQWVVIGDWFQLLSRDNPKHPEDSMRREFTVESR